MTVPTDSIDHRLLEEWQRDGTDIPAFFVDPT